MSRAGHIKITPRPAASATETRTRILGRNSHFIRGILTSEGGDLFMILADRQTVKHPSPVCPGRSIGSTRPAVYTDTTRVSTNDRFVEGDRTIGHAYSCSGRGHFLGQGGRAGCR